MCLKTCSVSGARLLESDYCRIEIVPVVAEQVHAGELESDYCRIEIAVVSVEECDISPVRIGLL